MEFCCFCSCFLLETSKSEIDFSATHLPLAGQSSAGKDPCPARFIVDLGWCTSNCCNPLRKNEIEGGIGYRSTFSIDFHAFPMFLWESGCQFHPHTHRKKVMCRLTRAARYVVAGSSQVWDNVVYHQLPQPALF